MVDLPSEFRAHLDSYRGPLDLLLFLIKRDEVDVFEIPIARIVEQYHVYLEILQQVDPNLCGDFLVMAAHLMEIKSKLLLPREELSAEEGEAEDPRLELVRQLLEYKKYKERAMLLHQRFSDRSRRHERPFVEISEDALLEGEPVSIGNVSVWALFTAFHRIQLALGQRAPHRVVAGDRPIEEFIGSIHETLGRASGRKARFEDLFSGATNREDAIGLLLAILQMAKDYLLVITQDQVFGPIEVRLRDEEEVRQIQAALSEEGPAPVDPAEEFLKEGEGRQALLEPVEEQGPIEETVGEAGDSGGPERSDPS